MRIAALPPPKDFSKDLDKQIDANRVEALVLTPDQFMSVLKDKTAHDQMLEYNVRLTLQNTVFGQYWNKTFYPNVNDPAVLPLGQVAADLYALTHTLRALGVVGTRIYTKTVNGKTYLIFKGYPGLRNLVKGTRFLATNAQIVQLGLGVRGAANVAKGGFILGLVVTTGIEVTDFVLNDQKTMADLVGSIGYEVVKSGVVAGLALGIAAGVGVAGSIAIAPLGVMVVLACGIGIGLNMLDNHYGVKDKVLKTLKTLPAGLGQGIYRLTEEAFETLEPIKHELDKKIMDAEQQIARAATEVAKKAAEAALNMLQKELVRAIQQFLRPH